jgi:hypothetical protein
MTFTRWFHEAPQVEFSEIFLHWHSFMTRRGFLWVPRSYLLLSTGGSIRRSARSRCPGVAQALVGCGEAKFSQGCKIPWRHWCTVTHIFVVDTCRRAGPSKSKKSRGCTVAEVRGTVVLDAVWWLLRWNQKRFIHRAGPRWGNEDDSRRCFLGTSAAAAVMLRVGGEGVHSYCFLKKVLFCWGAVQDR